MQTGCLLLRGHIVLRPLEISGKKAMMSLQMPTYRTTSVAGLLQVSRYFVPYIVIQ